jgi:hypothetical protein
MSARVQRSWLAFLAALACAWLAGCDDTERAFVAFEMHARGDGEARIALGDFELQLSRAEVALGPFTFCASAAADADLCHTSVAELREVAVVDLLAPEPTRVGRVEATTGMVRSGMLDYGRPWLLTAPEPELGPRSLDGHSALFAGEACEGDACFDFEIELDLTPPHPGDATLSGLDTSFAVIEGGQRIDVRVEARAWLEGVRFEELAVLATPGEPLRLEPGSQAYEAIAFAMTTGAPPRIEWRER